MSVINRIEIANWLDLTRTREWNPDFRHVVLDFRGQSTAVQAHNGTGKTRMTRAILALLGRDREFTSDARAKMAPRSAPCESHIRMEVLHPLDWRRLAGRGREANRLAANATCSAFTATAAKARGSLSTNTTAGWKIVPWRSGMVIE